MASVLDYPSQERGTGWRVPEPMLLDTCVVQNLAWIFGAAEDHWTDEAVGDVRARFSPELAVEILCLGDLVFIYGERADSPLWAVSGTSRAELGRVPGPKGRQLLRWWRDLADFWEGVVFGGGGWPQIVPDDVGPPVSRHQLAFSFEPPVPSLERPIAPAFGPFRDAGDRALIRDAMRAGFPAILTTDVRSFWRHRSWLYQFGIEVWRPRDLWQVFFGREPADLVAV